MHKPRFRQYLIDRKLITSEQLHAAVLEQERFPHKKLGQILCDKGFLKENHLLNILTHYTGIPPFPGIHSVDKGFSHANLQLTASAKVVPFRSDNQGLHVAMIDPENVLLRDQLQHHYRCKIIPYHITDQLFDELVEHYASQDIHSHKSQTFSPSKTPHLLPHTSELSALIIQALRQQASDIHCQPTRTHLTIRYRIDGLLAPIKDFHNDIWPALRTQIKVLAGIDVSEERKPQHGRFQKNFAGRTIDFRVSCHPTIDGENIVIRILDKQKSLISFDALGFSPSHKQTLRQCIQYNHGLILFTGPTGSGKTTSLYALLSEMNHESRNIMTLEQPVEYAISGIRQSEITQNMSFAEGVRSLLRQDPDVILIGEIRDEDTAQMALRAAMTGHLVLSTLHTHDVFSVPHRLINLGIRSDLLASHLLCIVSQRLVRTRCKICHAQGCHECQNTGLKGRTCVSECLFVDDTIRDLIAENAPTHVLKKAYPQTLWQDGLAKITEGMTTVEEVTRVLGPKNPTEKEKEL